MAVRLLYGDEPQLIEEQKRAFFKAHGALPVKLLNDEAGTGYICEELSADSLFGDSQVLCLVNPPLFHKAGKKNDESWDKVRDALMNYTGDNPVIIIYHDGIDKRLKDNKELLAKLDVTECNRLKGDELLKWLRDYCKKNGFTLAKDALEYLRHMLDLWQDVPVSFLRTEFDRFFLQLPPKSQISRDFLLENGSDYGAKNIFLFKEALLNGQVQTLLELFPFMLSNKESERAISYMEGQLRLQLMVCECRAGGMSERDVQGLFQRHGSATKAYPIKLAYQAARGIPIGELAKLLADLYDCMAAVRRGEGDLTRFRDSCLAFCEERRRYGRQQA